MPDLAKDEENYTPSVLQNDELMFRAIHSEESEEDIDPAELFERDIAALSKNPESEDTRTKVIKHILK